MHIIQNFLIGTILNCQNKGMDLIDEGYTCLLSEVLSFSQSAVTQVLTGLRAKVEHTWSSFF